MKIEDLPDYIPEKSGKILLFITTVLGSLFRAQVSKIVSLASSIFGKPPAILNSESAWYKNLALMRDAEDKTNDPALKNRIRFLLAPWLPPSVFTQALTALTTGPSSTSSTASPKILFPEVNWTGEASLCVLGVLCG
jgi:hypothetical protein